jgi:hypothetical protein
MVLAQKQEGRLMDQNRRPRHKLRHLQPTDFDKGAQSTRWRIDSFFNTCFWEKWISTSRRQKIGPCLSLYTNINSKWIKDYSIRLETLKQLQEAVGNALDQLV